MTRTGRRPRPTALKILQGERPSRVNDDEMPAPAGAPGPPDDLDADVARAYRQLVELLEPTGVLTGLDGLALLAFAQAVSTHSRAAALESAVGPLVRDEHNQPRVNPASRIRRDAGRDVLRWASEFGMTPASRSQIARRLAGSTSMHAPNPTAAKYLTGGAS
jgi:P27 family predicted phage terminase small subunit